MPTCGASVTVLIVNVANGQCFCTNALATHAQLSWRTNVLTVEDVAWLRACGIDPKVDNVEAWVKKRLSRQPQQHNFPSPAHF